MLTTSIALLGAYAGPWLLQIPPSESTAVFKDSLAEPSSRVLMLIGCGMLAAYGLAKQMREKRKASISALDYPVLTRRAA